MHLDAIEHADEIGDIEDSLLARQIEAGEQFEQATRKAFANAFRGELTCVEWVHYPFMNGPSRIRTQSTREAFLEEMEYTEAENAFWAMLKDSTCPHVTAFKQLITDTYVQKWKNQISEFRGEA